MAWVRDLDKDEIRSGFLVSAHRKHIWETELELLAELDRVCQKYGLLYYVDGGTLLGAVRHQGFIPWDDDIDVVMFRKDYERLKDVGADEFTGNLFFQTAYTDNALFNMAKIRNSKTMGLEYYDRKDFNQGIFLDIFPFDDISDGSEEQNQLFAWRQELYVMALMPEVYKEAEDAQVVFAIPENERRAVMSMSAVERFRIYEEFQREHTGESGIVTYMPYEFTHRYKEHFKRTIFEKVVQLKFEGRTVPAPVEYDRLLKIYFGDYHTPVKFAADHGNNILFSADVSYKEYQAVQQVNQI